MTAPLVSIVTPSFNQGRYLAATLESVKSQEYPLVEHIVVDGGSTDGSLEILAAYEDRYQLKWSSGPDSGMYDAINRGMTLARGDILAYLNSDDLLLPWTVATAVASLQDGTADVVFGDLLRFDESRGSVELVFSPPFHPSFIRRLGSLFQPTVMWRRSVTESTGPFDTRLQFGGDLDFWIRSLSGHRFKKINEVLAVERIHPAAKSSAMVAEWRAEERSIRGRHETGSPPEVALSRAVQRARSWGWRRRYWLEFSRATRSPNPRSWRRFIDSCRPSVATAPWLLAQIPVIGARHVKNVLPNLDLRCVGLDPDRPVG